MIFGPKPPPTNGAITRTCRSLEAEHAGESVAQEHRRLRRVPDRELIGARIPIGDDAAGLHRRGCAVIVEKAPRDDPIRLGARGRVVAAVLPDMRGDVGAHVVMNARRRVAQRFFQIDHGRQRLDINLDITQRILGQIAAVRQHDGKRLADMADFVLGERHLGALVEDGVFDRRRRHQQRARRPIVAEIGGGVDGDDALARAAPPTRRSSECGRAPHCCAGMPHRPCREARRHRRTTPGRAAAAHLRYGEWGRRKRAWSCGRSAQPLGSKLHRLDDMLIAGATA